MPNSDEPDPVCPGECDGFIGGAPADDESESVVTVERAGAWTSGLEVKIGLRVQGASGQASEIVGQSRNAMGVDTPEAGLHQTSSGENGVMAREFGAKQALRTPLGERGRGNRAGSSG